MKGKEALLGQSESNARIRHRVRLAPPQTVNLKRERENGSGEKRPQLFN